MTASLQQATSIVLLALIVLTNIIAGMGKTMILSPNFTHRGQSKPESDGGDGCPPPPFDPDYDPNGGCPPPPFELHAAC